MRRCDVTILAALLLFAPALASAGTIQTAPLTRDETEVLLCSVANGTSKTLGPIRVEILDMEGTAVNFADLTLEPGASNVLIVDDLLLGGSPMGRCTVSGKGVSRKKVLVSFCTFGVTTNACIGAR